MMDGRLKTLHPNIFGGILADRSNPDHLEAIAIHGIELFDIVVVNLYAFSDKPGIENIDIGGPSLLRAAAKNANHVTVVVNPGDYELVISQIKLYEYTDIELRETLALQVFVHTTSYDRAIMHWFMKRLDNGEPIFSRDKKG